MANLNYIIEFSFSFCTKCCTYVWENVNLNTEIHCHFTYCIAILHITFQIEFCYTYASIRNVLLQSCLRIGLLSISHFNRFIIRLRLELVMPSSHCTILAGFFTRRQVLINRWQMPKIGGKSVLIHASDNRAVWIIKDAIWENRRFKILLCEMSSDWNVHRRWPTANERARYRAAGSSGRTFVIFYKAINMLAIYKQRAYIFALE